MHREKWTRGKPRGYRTPILVRIMARVTVTESQCWEVDGANNGIGYALVGEGGKGGRMLYAHRVVYELLVGQIPDGLVLDHLCRNTRCCNPDHLEPVTQRENLIRGIGPSAKAAAATECVNGHPFDEQNTYVHPRTGHRSCRKCHARWARELRQRRKESA